MTPQPFKVGDRVRVYGDVRPKPGYYKRGHRATVELVMASDELGVVFDGDRSKETFGVHPKQCRRLNRKERRRVFLRESHIPKLGCVHVPVWSSGEADVGEELVEFIEVPRKGRV